MLKPSCIHVVSQVQCKHSPLGVGAARVSQKTKCEVMDVGYAKILEQLLFLDRLVHLVGLSPGSAVPG